MTADRERAIIEGYASVSDINYRRLLGLSETVRDVNIDKYLGNYNGYDVAIILPDLSTDDLGFIYIADCEFTLSSGMAEIIVFSDKGYALDNGRYYPDGCYGLEYAFLRNYIIVDDLHKIKYYAEQR